MARGKMDYHDKQEGKCNLMRELEALGWKAYGYKKDTSDCMTDYFNPEHWEGIATKGEYVVCVDVYGNTRSGKDETRIKYHPDLPCAHCQETGIDPSGWTLQKARANPRDYHRETTTRGCINLMQDVVSPIPFDSAGRLKCRQCKGAGHSIRQEEYVAWTWPKFQKNPPRRLWHVEKDGKIIASGIGLSACCGYWKDAEAIAGSKALAEKIDKATRGADDSAADPAPTVDRPTMRENKEKDGLEIIFPGKPDSGTLALIKKAGFRWSRGQNLWYAKQTAARLEIAFSVCGIPNKLPEDRPRGESTYEFSADELESILGVKPEFRDQDYWHGGRAIHCILNDRLLSYSKGVHADDSFWHEVYVWDDRQWILAHERPAADRPAGLLTSELAEIADSVPMLPRELTPAEAVEDLLATMEVFTH